MGFEPRAAGWEATAPLFELLTLNNCFIAYKKMTWSKYTTAEPYLDGDAGWFISQDGGVPSKDLKSVAALLFIKYISNAWTLLKAEMCNMFHNMLNNHPIRMAKIKKLGSHLFSN